MRNNTSPDGATLPLRQPEASRLKVQLGKEAVQLALNGEWPRAAAVNRAILELFPDDCEAGNRLAKALIESGDYPAAHRVLDSLRRRFPANAIARKNLARLDKLQGAGPAPHHDTAQRPAAAGYFVEEGGKSCATVLRRPPGAPPFAIVAAGDALDIALHEERVIARTRDGQMLGSIEPGLSRRLRKLINGGNRYDAVVVGTGPAQISVILRETARHPSLRNVVSFPARYRKPDNTPPQDETPDDQWSAPAAEPVDDPDGDADPESAAVALLSDETDDDADADDAVPVLDTDPEPQHLPIFVQQDDPDWE